MQNTGIEEVFDEIKASFTLRIVFEIVIPVSAFLHLYSVVRKMQSGETSVRRHAGHTRFGFHGTVKRAILVSQAVIIAESNERTQLMFNRLWQCGITCNLILNDRRFFSLHYEYDILNL